MLEKQDKKIELEKAKGGCEEQEGGFQDLDHRNIEHRRRSEGGTYVLV
jgi:hypothetical protein